MTAPGDDGETGPNREPGDEGADADPQSERDPQTGDGQRDETVTGSDDFPDGSGDQPSRPDDSPVGPDDPPAGPDDSPVVPDDSPVGPDEFDTTPDDAREETGVPKADRAGKEDADSDASQGKAAEWRRQDREDRRPPVVGDADGSTAEATGDRSAVSWKLFTRDVVSSVLAVALLGMYLFAISGVWPPMVAIESGSMEPNMEVNDLVFLMETERFQPEEAHRDTGVVTAAIGSETGYGTYGGDGDVIVFEPDGNGNTTPIIHRAMFWVEEGENWCELAEPRYLGSLDTDDEDCIAPNDGFITKGDNNNRYDQASVQAERPIKPEWVVGTAEARIPRLGWFRLRFQ